MGSGGGSQFPGPTGPAPAPTVTLVGQSVSYSVFKAVVPSDLNKTTYSNMTAFDKDGCRISFWPPVPATGDLDAQALQILTAQFPNCSVHGLLFQSPLDDFEHVRGISGEGWQYVELQGELYNTPSNSQCSGQYVRILLAELGDQVAPMMGWEDSAKNSHCLHNEVLDLYDWTPIVYSLSFPSYQAPNPHALRDELVGAWFGAEPTMSVVWQDVYSGNGRHSDLVGIETWKTLNATEVLSTFSTWQGTGYWAVNKNLVTLWPDNKSDPAVTQHFRIYQEHNTSEPTGWKTTMRRLGLCGGQYCEGWADKD